VPEPRRRRVLREAIVATALAALVVSAGFALARIQRLVAIGAGYVAKQGCSCVFIGGRTLDACRADMPESMRDIQAELLPEARAVRAWVGALGARTASFRDGTGCTLDLPAVAAQGGGG
jgi:hypothetical protein